MNFFSPIISVAADFSAMSVRSYQTTGHHSPEYIRLFLSLPRELQVMDIMFVLLCELLQFTFSRHKFEAWNMLIVIIIFIDAVQFSYFIFFFVAVLRIETSEASELTSGLLTAN